MSFHGVMLIGVVGICAVALGVVDGNSSDEASLVEHGWSLARATFYGSPDGRDGMGMHIHPIPGFYNI